MPSVGAGAVLSRVVRVSSMILPATCAVLVQTFWPRTRSRRRPLREGLDGGGVRASVGLGETERHLVLPLHRAQDPAGFLLNRAVNHDRVRPEQIDVHRRRRGHAAAVAGHLVHHHRGFGDAQARAAVRHRHGDAQPAGFGHRTMEGMREFAVFVARQPVVVAETAPRRRRFADGKLVFAE